MRKFWTKMIHPAHILTAVAAGVVAGVVLNTILRMGIFGSFLWLILAILLFVYASIRPCRMLFIFAIIAGMILSAWRMADAVNGAEKLNYLVGQEISLSGVVMNDVEKEENTASVKLRELRTEDTEIDGEIYAQVNTKAEIWRGDKITISGKVTAGFGSYGATMWRTKLAKWERPEPGDVLVKFRNNFAEKIEENVPEEEAKLGVSYLLGMRNGLSDEMTEILQTVGLTHLVVASGTHLGILVEVMRKIFGKISRMAGMIFAILFIILFASMIGWTASITRAAIVSILTLVTGYTGRKFQAWRLIIISMAVTLIINPANLSQLGWQLSFAAYAGITMLGPWIKNLLYGKEKVGALSEVIISSLAASLACLPLQIYYFGSFSLLALPANLLILPTMSLVMGLLFVSGAAGLWLPMGGGVAWLAGRAATLVLDYHLWAMKLLAEQKAFLLEVEPYQSWILYWYSVPVLLWLVRRGVKWRRRYAKKYHQTLPDQLNE